MEVADMKQTSVKVSSVLEDIGVTEEMVYFRRHIRLLMEKIQTILNKQLHKPGKTYIFGSQSEGSTTQGMQSDTDQLNCYNIKTACFTLSRYDSPQTNIINRQTAYCLPQCCILQYVLFCDGDKAIPLRESHLNDSIKREIGNDYIIDEDGQILFSHTNLFLELTEELNEKVGAIEQHGPALTIDLNIDMIFAIYCPTLPNDLLAITLRHKPGHWPKHETVEKARGMGMFLVAPGNLCNTSVYRSRLGYLTVRYPKEFLCAQWRMSTNRIERLLMFDLNIIQMKTYILLKMVRKEFLAPVVDGRLSTFHIKTAFLFTLENIPEEEWQTENIIKCAIYSIYILRRFLKRRFCPHYTVASVNLFAGKLEMGDYETLEYKLITMAKSKLECVFRIQIDDLGSRLSTVPGIGIANFYSRQRNVNEISFSLSLAFAAFTKKYLASLNGQICFGNRTLLQIMKECAYSMKVNSEKKSDFKVELCFVLQNISSFIASLEASDFIANQQPVPTYIFKMYENSLKTGEISNYLKYASFLVMINRLNAAEKILEDVGKLCASNTVENSLTNNFCSKVIPVTYPENAHTSTERLISYATKLVFDVEYRREEVHCVPNHLRYEMYRTITADDFRDRINTRNSEWMDYTVVDAKPFLFFLQYLSAYTNEKKKRAAKQNLNEYICKIDVSIYHGHPDTTYTMMGSILELENNITEAWKMYKKSVQLVPRNNAAYWHLFRLVGQHVFGVL
ncbi:hypothetical protein DPMN_101691 [Dreissena polymorpha]|uniref:Mab-21-like HhH/H2TH-like domain-containing protein n=1 Tax=Dreissena polymorpha TaxID=45954 RepID=A0A9D4LJ89_DREPO|nr:hypothetical protein DPMN_101691 [Dreissena polymorpha]